MINIEHNFLRFLAQAQAVVIVTARAMQDMVVRIITWGSFHPLDTASAPLSLDPNTPPHVMSSDVISFRKPSE